MQKHFASPQVQAALKEHRFLKPCLVSAKPMILQAMQTGAWREVMTSLSCKSRLPVLAVPKVSPLAIALHSHNL